MRIFVALALLLLAGTFAPFALADDAVPAEPGKNSAVVETHAQRLDRLFAELKRERNDRIATHISQRIWQEWSQSGSASVDLMMGWAQKAVEEKKFDVALDFLDQRQHVAHAKDALGQTIRMERLQRIGLLAGAKELDRPSRYITPRQFGTAAGIPVGPCQDPPR